MFSDKLAGSLLRICGARHLNYEQASERCGCSSRHFGSIVRRQASPNLGLFERICEGFGRSPNQLLGIGEEMQPYRQPMAVVELRTYRSSRGMLVFPVCSRCNCSLEREYQSYCDRCGQCLDWSALGKMVVQRKGNVKSYAQKRFWSLAKIYYRGRPNRPLITA